MPGICQTALAAIAELQREHGIVPTPDEIVRLHALGVRVEDPEPGERLALLGCPVKCGNAVLFRLTVAGETWWRDLACQWWTGSDLYLTASLAFAMAHGRTPDALPMDRPAAFRAVRTWFRGLRVTRAEVNAAIEDVLTDATCDRAEEIHDLALRLLSLAEAGSPDLRAHMQPILDATAKKHQKPMDWDAMMLDLAVATGTTPDYWSHVSREYVVRAWIRARRHELARAGMPADGDTNDARQTEAIKALRQEIVAIVAARGKGTTTP
jgi:hypothetical protein